MFTDTSFLLFNDFTNVRDQKLYEEKFHTIYNYFEKIIEI